MKLVIGLGNPDKEYFNTFHNLGFACADKVASAFGVEFNKTKCKAQIAEVRVNGEKVIIAKPLTYMNLSGESVRELVSFYKIDLKDIIVAFDDYDLPKGVIRVKEKGSAGTHNGMKSIINLLGTTEFARVKIGFKPSEPTKIPLIDLVLSKIPTADKEVFEKSILEASKAVEEFVKGASISDLQQKYN